MLSLRTSCLHYTERTGGEFRDLRQVELKLRRWRRWCRISLNGQYRTSKTRKRTTRSANLGWCFGTEWINIEWVKFRRHCWHFSLNYRKRGITFSYGKGY